MAFKGIRFVAAASLLALLSACGGGSDNDDDDGGSATPPPAAASPVDKYVGEWTACYDEGDGTSSREHLVATKTSATVLSFEVEQSFHNGAGCAGAAVRTEPVLNGTATFEGTKTVDGATVDKVTVRETDGGVEKQIFAVRDGDFFTGVPVDEDRPDSVEDADGYPTQLDDRPFEKL